MVAKLGVVVYMVCTVCFSCVGCKHQASLIFRYPESWPIKEVTVPIGALQINIPDDLGGTSARQALDGELRDPDTRTEHRIWQVAFTDPGLETQLVNYYDEIFRMMAFALLNAGVPKYGERIYISQNKRQQVSFKWQDSHRFAQAGEFRGYVLTIRVYSAAQEDIKNTSPIPQHGVETE